ncbi:MAG: two-component regulator propeller domain-containing protein [Ferruginibacter sp.]
MRARLPVILLFRLLASPILTPAQQYLFKNYTANDGLVANSVRTIIQDRKGFIWIGTREGISKYDGNLFTSFTTANGLSDNLVNDFFESENGTLYIATNDGTVVIADGNKLTPCIRAPGTIINRFFRTTNGRVLVSTDHHGLAEFRNNQLHAISQPFPHSVYGEIINLNDSLLLVAGDSSLDVISNRYALYSSSGITNGNFTDYQLFIDSRKRIWAGAYSGLQQIAWPVEKGQQLRFIPLPPAFHIPELTKNTITAIFEDKEQVCWIGTSKGLVRIDPDGSHQVFTKQDGLADDFISCIFQDREKNLWFGTLGGVTKLVTASGIRIYTSKEGLASNSLSFVSRYKKDALLINSVGGLQVFDTKTEKATPLSNPSGLPFYDKIINSDPPLLLSAGQIVYVDTITAQIGKYYPLDKKVYTLSCAAGKDAIFLYSNDGLFFTNGKKTPVQILGLRTQSVVVDKTGALWAGTWWEGLYRYNYSIQNDSIIIRSKQLFFPGERIRSLFIDSRGKLWAGTRQHGVYIINPNDPRDHTILNQRSGLLSDFVKQIVEDNKGNIWLAYMQGIDKLIRNNNGFRVFSFSKVNDFYPITYSMEVDAWQTLWLATQNGLVRITDTDMEKPGALPVYITRISSPDSVYPASVSSLSLGYQKNQLQFEFSAPGFINEKQLLYSYRLTGVDNNEWSPPSNEHRVSYASLQPGNYIFEVRSLGWNGEWGSTTRFTFSVAPAFWQTWWFRAGCVALIALLIFWLVRYRINHVRRQAGIRQKLAETEMAALRAQMNPHFIFNCINSIDALIQSNDKYQATVYLNKFAKLLRNILDSSKQNIVSLTKDLETLRLYVELEQFRNENKFTCGINVADVLSAGDYRVPPLIIQPFVENAILHGLRYRPGNDGRLSITVTKTEDHIHYTIEDNGVGRHADGSRVQKEKRSYGIQMSQERVKLFNKEENASVLIHDLVAAGNPAGTKVEVFLKIQ